MSVRAKLLGGCGLLLIVPVTMARRALIVGINHYDNLGDAWNLHGAVSDAKCVAEMLSTHHNGDPNYRCKLLTSDDAKPVTRDRLLEALDGLFRNNKDEVLFYFSGHGTVTKTGGHIYTQDATPHTPGILMDELLARANRADEKEIIILLDACMSGTMGNPILFQGNGDYSQSLLSKNVSILAASLENEAAMEEAGQGIFTTLLLDALDGTAANILGNITLPSIYSHIEGALGPWDQSPIYKTYAASVNVIRVAAPHIDRPSLRRITELFPSSDALYQLSPKYEYDRIPETEKQKIGHLFKRYRNVGLVCTEIPGQDFYWVAEDSGCLKLTQLGRHFWGLITEGRI